MGRVPVRVPLKFRGSFKGIYHKGTIRVILQIRGFWGFLSIRVPYYFRCRKKDTNLENYPYGSLNHV